MKNSLLILLLCFHAAPSTADDNPIFVFKDYDTDHAIKGICSSKKPTPDSICEMAIKYCELNYGTVCTEWDESKLKLRFENPELKRTVVKKTKELFNRIKNDPENIKRCCADDTTCQTQLAKVKLKILSGNTNINVAYYQYPDKIEISEGNILSAQNAQVIEHILLHEFGHACQGARNPTSAFLYCQTNTGGTFKARQSSLSDIGAVFGKKTETCVSEALYNSDQKKGEVKALECASGRVNEAFANMYLMHKRKNWSHWVWECRGEKDKGHEKLAAYLPCWLESDEVRKNLCGPKSQKESPSATQ